MDIWAAFQESSTFLDSDRIALRQEKHMHNQINDYRNSVALNRVPDLLLQKDQLIGQPVSIANCLEIIRCNRNHHDTFYDIYYILVLHPCANTVELCKNLQLANRAICKWINHCLNQPELVFVNQLLNHHGTPTVLDPLMKMFLSNLCWTLFRCTKQRKTNYKYKNVWIETYHIELTCIIPLSVWINVGWKVSQRCNEKKSCTFRIN